MGAHASLSTADEPFHCGTVHVIWRTEKQRKKRWKKVCKWYQDGILPTDPPEWVAFNQNRGGGGGP